MIDDQQSSEYRVCWLPKVANQLRPLAVNASSHDKKQEIVGAFARAMQTLKSEPKEWGEPERNTRKKGGLVCHGTMEPLIVQFAVFEIERTVFVLDVRLLSGK